MFDKIIATEMPNAFLPVQAEKITKSLNIFQFLTVKYSESTPIKGLLHQDFLLI